MIGNKTNIVRRKVGEEVDLDQTLKVLLQKSKEILIRNAKVKRRKGIEIAHLTIRNIGNKCCILFI